MIRRRPLAAAVGQALPNQQAGFGLLGIIVTAALSAAVVGVAYVAYRQTSLTADAASAAQSARDIANRVQAGYASAPNFDLLNNASASRDRLWPGCPPVPVTQAQNPPPCPAPVNPWGAAVQVAGTATGFAVTDEQVPSDACVRLVTASTTGWLGVTVNGTSVMQGRTVQPAAAATLCNASPTATVQFLGGRATGNTMPTLTACVPPAPATQTLACPSGQISSVPPYTNMGITQTNQGFCSSAYGLPGVTPWTTVSDTCAPQCVATPTSSTTPNSQPAGCPSGQVTSTGTTSFTQTSTTTTTNTASCPAPTGPATYTTTTSSTPWTPTVASACAPKCVAPAPTTNTGTQPASCPSGQVTSTGATSFTQTHTQPVTYACPSPQGSYTTTPGTWSPWSPTVASVCAPKCVAPGPSTKTQMLGCPAPQTGSITQSQTTTYSCPSPQGSAVGTAGAWVTTSNTCTTPSPPPSPCFTPTVTGLKAGYHGGGICNNGNSGACPATWSVVLTSVADCVAFYSSASPVITGGTMNGVPVTMAQVCAWAIEQGGANIQPYVTYQGGAYDSVMVAGGWGSQTIAPFNPNTGGACTP